MREEVIGEEDDERDEGRSDRGLGCNRFKKNWRVTLLTGQIELQSV